MNSSPWTSSQIFGDPSAGPDDLLEGDIVTSVEFSEDGEFIAFGDRAGRIWLYQEGGPEESITPEEEESSLKTTTAEESMGKTEYQYFLQFQSHEPEFDYLKSLEIEEKINMLRFCKRQSESLFLLSTNDKTVKLWKVHNKKILNVSDFNVEDEETIVTDLKIPKISHFETITTSTCKKQYSNSHTYHINSISLNTDGETFISADDLRVNLWNLDYADQSFNIIDIKPENMEDLTEVITSATFHPVSCNLLTFASSRGSVRLVDLRDSALSRSYAQVFKPKEDPAEKSFFSEIISSISDVQFTPSGDYLLSRDYLTVKVWDIRKSSKPVEVIPIHDYLRPELCKLYENDCIFDKFECASSLDGTNIVTGSYDDDFFVYNWAAKEGEVIRAAPSSTPQPSAGRRPVSLASPSPSPEPNLESIDYNKKSLHVAWHPFKDLLAVGSMNNLFLFERS